MTFDLILEGKAYVNYQFQSCCIGMTDGKISAIKKVLTGGKKKQFSKELILPAGIDIHVHFRDPGFPGKETFLSGSKAAAFGGISCVFDMPNTKPQTIKIQDINEKIEIAEKKSVIDFGLYAGICDSNIEKLSKLQDHVNGFKVFLGSTTNSLHLTLKNLHLLFSKEIGIKKPVLFHAEDHECLIQNRGIEKNLKDHHMKRPIECELKAIQTLLEQAPFSFPIHICHISSKESLQLLNQFSGPISKGVTPHHSLLHIDNTHISNPTWYKVNPSLRPQYQQEALLQGLQHGIISILESDHAPHSLQEKEVDFEHAPSGISGVETMFPLFLYKAMKQDISFQRVMSLICEKPAELMHIKKGNIVSGYDADLIVVNPKEPTTITSELLHSKADFTPFEGFPALFPQQVFVRGESVIDNKELVMNPGHAKKVQ